MVDMKVSNLVEMTVDDLVSMMVVLMAWRKVEMRVVYSDVMWADWLGGQKAWLMVALTDCEMVVTKVDQMVLKQVA